MSASPNSASLREKLFTLSLASSKGLLSTFDARAFPLTFPSNLTALNCIMSIMYRRFTFCRLITHESDSDLPMRPLIFTYCLPCSNRKFEMSMLSLSMLIFDLCTFQIVSLSTTWLGFNSISVCSLPLSAFFEKMVFADTLPLYVTLVLFPQKTLVARVSLYALALRLTFTIAPFFINRLDLTWQCKSSSGFSNSSVVDSYFLLLYIISGILALIYTLVLLSSIYPFSVAGIFSSTGSFRTLLKKFELSIVKRRVKLLSVFCLIILLFSSKNDGIYLWATLITLAGIVLYE